MLIYLALRTLYSGLLGSYSDMLLILVTVSTLTLTGKCHQFAFLFQCLVIPIAIRNPSSVTIPVDSLSPQW